MSDMQTEDEAAVAEFKAFMADAANRQAFVAIKHQAVEEGARRHYKHVLQAVSTRPWAVLEPMFDVICDILTMRVAGERFSAEEIDARIGARRPAMPPAPTGVAVLSMHGVIIPKAGMMTEMSGGTSIEGFRQQFRQAMASSEVSGIVLDVDSPGGMVDGVPEMAAEIRAARGTKPIVAVANTEAGSAAYWLATQADELVVSKSGRVGSVGVFAKHEDTSAKDAAEGVKTTIVHAGRFKTEGNPHEPLTDAGLADMQRTVDAYMSMFVTDVAKGRRVSVETVRSGFGEGRMVMARDAIASGMADRIATTEDVVAEMLGAAKLSGMAAFAAHEAESDTEPLFAVSAIKDLSTPDTSATALTPEREEELRLRAELLSLSE